MKGHKFMSSVNNLSSPKLVFHVPQSGRCLVLPASATREVFFFCAY